MNHIVLMGRLTRDPELRHTQSGTAVASFTLAVDRPYSGRDGGDRQTDFIDIVAWRGTADFVCRYFRKGQMMAVHGSIQTRTYTDKDGNKRKAFEIVASDVNFADSKRENDGSRSAPQYSAPATYTSSAPFIEPDADNNPVFSSDEYEPIKMSDEDLPF